MVQGSEGSSLSCVSVASNVGSPASTYFDEVVRVKFNGRVRFSLMLLCNDGFETERAGSEAARQLESWSAIARYRDLR